VSFKREGERARETERASETLVRERESEREEKVAASVCVRGEREQDVDRHAGAPESSEFIGRR
jgi:hypothetical protein